jgi:hypothetical protein
MIEVSQQIPRGLLNFVAGENHIDAGINRIFHLDRQYAGVSM